MTHALASLSVDELRGIVSALRASRLTAPLSQTALTPYLNRGAADASLVLVRLTAEGLTAEHLAYFLDALASERENYQRSGAHVELVSTGPEPEGLPARDTRIVVRELFRKAERSVVVAGYAIYQGREVFRALAERMDEIPHLSVQMFLDVQRVHGDTTRPSEILREFSDRFRKREWPGSRTPEVYYDPRSLHQGPKRASLHAKCVVVDNRAAFVSSANFTEAAQVRNIEVGVLIRSEPFAARLAEHFLGLADQRQLERVPGL